MVGFSHERFYKGWSRASERSGICRENAVEIEELAEDILLFAYVDGELDDDQRRLVEDLMSKDPDVGRRIAQIRELSRLIKAAYEDDGDEPA